ncbi:MAG: helix-turn-helix domain-containing protein [Acidobacteria bacterium]|nr:MAG: helix-turn-helix domain-containing protein [Acidobacteriota bacterium]
MSPLNEFGLHLKQARENRGLSLRQIAGATKISTVALEALERGDFSRLPGGIFSRAFVRAYAIEVGLDPDETVAKYAELADAIANASSRPAAPAEISDDDRAFLERQRQAGVWLRVIAVVLLVAIVGTVAWWMTSRPKKSAAVVTTTQEPAPATPPPAPVVAAPIAEPPVQARAIVMKLRADEGCWVQIIADGRSVLSRNLTAGESQTIEADRDVSLQFGNAGAISWTINGRAAKALGALGEVKRATVTKDNVTEFLK